MPGSPRLGGTTLITIYLITICTRIYTCIYMYIHHICTAYTPSKHPIHTPYIRPKYTTDIIGRSASSTSAGSPRSGGAGGGDPGGDDGVGEEGGLDGGVQGGRVELSVEEYAQMSFSVEYQSDSFGT
jgi:hypothetical protein